MYDCRVILDDEIEAALRSRFPNEKRMATAVRRALHEWMDARGTQGRIVTDRQTLDEVIRAAMRDQDDQGDETDE